MQNFAKWFVENTSHGMMIRIVDRPVVTGGSSAADNYRKIMQQIAGQWLPVETDHLFSDQFNTGVPHNLRVMIQNVADVKNDMRPMAAQCGYCGQTYLNVPDKHLGQPCPKCNAYPAQDLAVIDRIRPLITVEGGKVNVVYPAKQKISTPEGPVWR